MAEDPEDPGPDSREFVPEDPEDPEPEEPEPEEPGVDDANEPEPEVPEEPDEPDPEVPEDTEPDPEEPDAPEEPEPDAEEEPEPTPEELDDRELHAVDYPVLRVGSASRISAAIAKADPPSVEYVASTCSRTRLEAAMLSAADRSPGKPDHSGGSRSTIR